MKLEIDGSNSLDFSYAPELDYISNIIKKFRNPPSIVKIKEQVKPSSLFYFNLLKNPPSILFLVI